ncbi:uncharacterized protein KIAA1671 homolog isoform X2 [Hemicordylus capensis]|uniref:uncharacterized protein KIAA1671 homolog isoform X2 n=1 Tax=Hemicordylus capensis TaxID=884348 RepID=UPI0023033CDB|nr:uncharacterized protein KIAA1671 homolog isoform X2 [Hemicordylus capensis]
MATQVEVGSALPPLTHLSELTSEAKLQQAFASSQPSELPSSFLLEERSPLRPAPVAPAASRPWLTPKPFSREKSSDTFTMVKPPVSAPKPSAFAKTFEETTAGKGSTGNVPPLVDQKSIDHKSPSDELVANMPFYSRPQANTVILFETGSAEKTRMTLTPDKSVAGFSQTFSTLQPPKGPLPLSKSEVSYRRPKGAGIHRQLSLSSESRPVSWNPCRPLEQKDTFAGAAEERALDQEQQPGSSIALASEMPPRPKQRPVSALFLESLKDPKPCGSDLLDEKPLEKSWVRKPRPLSMDLTAKFENRDLSVQRKSCPSEIKGPKSDPLGLGRADPSKLTLKTTFQTDSTPGVKSHASSQTPKPPPNEAASSCRNAPKDLGQALAKDSKYLWEQRLKNPDEENEPGAENAATSDHSKEPPKSKGLSVKEMTVLNQKRTRAVSETSANATDAENRSMRGGSAKKPVNLLDASANSPAPVNAEPLPESPGKESRVLNIQQRIKELTAENADVKPGNLRRSFRSRPLSADLTKLFSSPVTGSEAKPERQAEPDSKSVSEIPETEENEASPLGGMGSCVVGPPWKPRQPLKIPCADGHLERDRSLKQNVALQSGSPSSVADRSLHTHSAPPAEKARLKTVRATLFEHNVQRHNVAADHHLGTELVGGQLDPRMEKALDPPTKKTPPKQADLLLDAKKDGNAKILNEGRVLPAAAWKSEAIKEAFEKPTPKHIEDSLMYQRIEPRYEILQTVGERAQSEVIATVPEEKAVTLRSRRSLKERRRTSGSVGDAAWPGGLDIQGGGWKEESRFSRTKDAEEVARQAASVQELHVSCSQREQVTELDSSQPGQQQVPGKASHFTNRSEGLGLADAKGSNLSSGAEKEKSDTCFAGRMEDFKIPKHESFKAGSGGIDGCEARSSASQKTTLASVSQPESSPSLGGTSQWPNLGRKASHPSSDARTHEQEEPKGFGLRKPSTAYGAQEELDVSGKTEGGRFQQPDVEERARRGGLSISAPKASERWRRKTLPHDTSQIEDIGAGNAKALNYRDPLQLCDGSIAKRNRRFRYGSEPREVSFVSPSSPDDCLKSPLSPSEPKATYFAVTYQIPDENENVSGKTLEPLKSKEFSSLAKNALFAPHVSASRRSLPSHCQHSQRSPDTQGTLDTHLSKSWGEGDTLDLSKKGTLKYPPTELRAENWRSLGRRQEDAQERVTDVDPPSLGVEPKSPSSFRHWHQNQEPLGPPKCSDRGHGTAEEKSAGNYRSKVLDIDALMAEYKEDSRKASAVLDRREGGLREESRLFPWEKLASARNSADRTSCGYNRSDPKGLDHPPASIKQGVSATESCGPENVCGSERQRLESSSPERSPLKARDGKFGPPHWARPLAEKPKYLPVDPVGTRKKTFILDEEQGESLLWRHHGAKYADHPNQEPSLACVDVEPETGLVPRPSQVLPDGGALRKGTGPQQQQARASSEAGWHQQHVSGRGLKKQKGGTDGSPLGADSPAVKSGAEWNSSVPSLAAVPPLDLKRSYSEKARPGRARGSLPSGPGEREKPGQPRVRPSFPPESVDGWLNQRSGAQQGSSFHEEKRDLGKEQTGQDRGAWGARHPAALSVQRRSRSFYKERTAGPWVADQLKQCLGRPSAEAKDTDTLVQEADHQYGTWSDQRHSGDSFAPESPSSESHVASPRKQPPGSWLSSFSSQTDPASATDQQDSSSREHRSTSLDRSSMEVDSADEAEEPAPAGASADFSFLNPTSVLDSSALKTRVQLSKRRRQHRAPISHSLRRSPGEEAGQQRPSVPEEVDSAWMFKDSTEEKSAKREDSEEEGKRRPAERLPVSQPQRLPVFPGMDHSALKAQLRKRHEAEGSGDGSPAQLSKSPKSPFPAGVLGSRVLPTGAEKEERPEGPSPQWLRDLKSKKRQSQHENQV